MDNSGLKDYILVLLGCQDITPRIFNCIAGPGCRGLVLSLLLQLSVQSSIVPFLLFGNLIARLTSIRFAAGVQRREPSSIDRTPLCLAHPIRR